MSNVYSGRILIINKDYEIIKDTYDLEKGKTIISQEVIQCFKGESTSQYDRRNNYIEMTVPIGDTRQEIYMELCLSAYLRMK